MALSSQPGPPSPGHLPPPDQGGLFSAGPGLWSHVEQSHQVWHEQEPWTGSAALLCPCFLTRGEAMGKRWHKARPGRCPPPHTSPLAGPLTLARVCPTLGQQIAWGCPLPPNLLADWPALDLPALRPTPQAPGRSRGLKGAVQGEPWGWAVHKAGRASKQNGGTHTHACIHVCRHRLSHASTCTQVHTPTHASLWKQHSVRLGSRSPPSALFMPLSMNL